jgi:invasion protein IalB
MLMPILRGAGLAAALLAAVPAMAAQPEAPKVTKEQRFGAWGLTCAVANDDKGLPMQRCMVSQLVSTDPQHGKVVLGITVDHADSPTVPTIRFRFSAAAQRKTGVGIKAGNAAPMMLAISDCNPTRCEAAGRLSPEVLKVWRSSRNARFAFRLTGGKQVTLPMSTVGLDQALEALRQQNAKARRQRA